QLLRENAIELGVSFDLVSGVRRSVTGRETETRVLHNIERLRGAGLAMGGLVVLAQHTLPRITEVYDFFAAKRMSVRVLPLFDGPTGRPEVDFAIGNDAIVDGLLVLFRHWLETGAVIKVEPLGEWLGNVLRKMLRVRGPLYNRRLH